MDYHPGETPTQVILDSIADGVFTVDSEWRITSFNKAAEKITGIKKKETLRRHCWEVFKASICERQCSLRYTMESGRPVVNQSIYILNASGDRIPVSISTAILKNEKGKIVGGVETFRDLSVVEALRKELAAQHTFQDIISKNKEMLRLFHMVELISESDTTVLIEGESGTGKELFAKAIHSLSSRKAGPMITINCGSLPDTLLESELFGYKAGAFTDAKKDKPGRVALAEGGTLFLDEIGDVSSLLQVRLLRILQDKTYEPLGSTQSEKADVRIVAASNRNIHKLVRKGLFREDLYYRINVVRLYLPPLRQRKEDIPLLADHFINKFNRLNNKDIQALSPEVLAALMAYDYPGNIRELENIIEYATVVCKNSLLQIEHLPDHIRKCTNAGKPEASVHAYASEPIDKKLSFSEIEKGYILSLLKKNNWSRQATADQMGIHPTTLWRKMKRLKINAPAQNPTEKAG